MFSECKISVICRLSRSRRCPFPQSSATSPASAQTIQTCQKAYRCNVIAVASVVADQECGLSSVSWLWQQKQLPVVSQVSATAQLWTASSCYAVFFFSGNWQRTTVTELALSKSLSVQWILFIYHLKPWWTPNCTMQLTVSLSPDISHFSSNTT